jgi:hypothetical protein
MRVPVVSISPVAPKKTMPRWMDVARKAKVPKYCVGTQHTATVQICREMFHVMTKKELTEKKEEELMPTWVLCCFLLSAAAVVLITRRPPNPSIPRLVSVSETRHVMPCLSFPSHPVMDPRLLSSSPFPCPVSANSYATNAARRALYCDKGKKTRCCCCCCCC